MTERQRARLLQAYVALAFIIAGTLVYNFLAYTLINLPAESSIATGQSLSGPCSVINPENRKFAATCRLTRLSGGSDQPWTKTSTAHHWPAAAAGRVADERSLSHGYGLLGAYYPRAPPVAAQR